MNRRFTKARTELKRGGRDKEGLRVLDTAPWRLHRCPLQSATFAFIVYLHFRVLYVTGNEEGRSCLSSGQPRACEKQSSAGAAVRKLNACEGSSGTHKGYVGQTSQRSALSLQPPSREQQEST